VVAELPLCLRLLPALILLRMLLCLWIEDAAGESVISGCLCGEAAPGRDDPELAVCERGRSVVIEGGFSAAYAADTACVAAMSSAFAEASSAFIVTLVEDDVGLTSFSTIPRWAKLKLPEPSVSIAGLRVSATPFVVVAAFSRPMTCSPPSSSLFTSVCCCWLGLPLLVLLLLAIVLLMLFAAFWAAEKTDAKNPPGL
jgi:hypothetical protein